MSYSIKNVLYNVYDMLKVKLREYLNIFLWARAKFIC